MLPSPQRPAATAAPSLRTIGGVTAEAMQRRTTVVIEPPGADEATGGHQVALDETGEVTVTVTSTDGSRTRAYRVRL